MDSFTVCAVGILCVVASTCIRSLKPEFSTVLRLAFCVLFGVLMLRAITPLTQQLRTWMDAAAAEYTGVLIKALGIALLTHLTAELCRDCGESTVAGGVETLGKLEILALCLPLIGSVLEMVEEILSW